TQVIGGVTTFVAPANNSQLNITLNIPNVATTLTSTGNFTVSGNPITDATTIATALNNMFANPAKAAFFGGGTATVTALSGSPYGFVINLSGTPFSGKDTRLMTATVAPATNPVTTAV